jgi:hypothetical protein
LPISPSIITDVRAVVSTGFLKEFLTFLTPSDLAVLRAVRMISIKWYQKEIPRRNITTDHVNLISPAGHSLLRISMTTVTTSDHTVLQTLMATKLFLKCFVDISLSTTSRVYAASRAWYVVNDNIPRAICTMNVRIRRPKLNMASKAPPTRK